MTAGAALGDEGVGELAFATPPEVGGDPAGDESPASVSAAETSEDEAEALRRRHEPAEDGRYYDDPLWLGKTADEIRRATEVAKLSGNEASASHDWKLATDYWKDALKGAEKMQDAGLELRLRLNLALGYVRREKPTKALEHCEFVFAQRLLAVATPELRAKAQFRRAEAHELAGARSKAIASWRACIELQPQCQEARQRLAALRQQEHEQRVREQALFKGKVPLLQADGDGDCRSADPAKDATSVSLGHPQPKYSNLSSDEDSSDEDATPILMPGLNMQCGPRLEFGPRAGLT